MLAVLALLVFGPESLPDIAKTVVRTIRAFRQASMDLQNEVKGALELETKQRQAPSAVAPAPPMTDDEVFEPTRKAVAATEVADVESTEVAAAESTENLEVETPVEVEPKESPPSIAAAEVKQVVPEPEDDDDGPGLPMTRPVRAASMEMDVEPSSEPERNATPVESAS